MAVDHLELRLFERDYVEILSLQDPEAVFRRIAAAVPRMTGMPVSSFGGLGPNNEMVLRHTVNAEAFEGMIVPTGAGLGGKVLVSQRPAWVSDYTKSDAITNHFYQQVVAEAVEGMVVVPVMHGDRLFGCLYAASRTRTDFGDRVADNLQLLADRAATAAVAAERAQRATEAAVAEERQRLALELHDTVGAALFTIHAGINRLGNELGSRHALTWRIRNLANQVTDTSCQLRQSMQALSASAEQIALSAALRRDCQAFQDRTGIRAALVLLTQAPALSPALIDALARATREALLNVEKHAAATSVVVSVFTAPRRVVVAVCDDGRGLAADRVAGLGLVSAAERLNRLGGDLSIGPGDDGGVTVEAWVPAPD